MVEQPPVHQRIQRRRTRGWRLPTGAVCVSRPSRWGNPWRAEKRKDLGWCCVDSRNGLVIQASDQADAHALAVGHYRAWIEQSDPQGVREAARQDLRGRPLCCWCPPHLECHADVLLEMANGSVDDEGPDVRP